MPDITQEHALEERLAALERRLGTTATKVDACADGFERRLRRLEANSIVVTDRRLAPPARTTRGSVPPPPVPVDRPAVADDAARVPEGLPVVDGPVEPRWSLLSLEELVAGRVLAWVGGAATLLGIVLFLALAISRGWIGHEARVALAAAGASALTGVGMWLHGHRGRTEASVVLVATGTAGMFATLVVASEVYRLIPSPAAIAGALLVGALATWLAIRWAGRAIGALGLVGALLSPVLAGAPASGATIAVLAVAAGCAMWVVIRQQWRWLALTTVLVSAPQWGVWILDGRSTSTDLLVLTWFTAIGLAGVISPAGRRRRGPEDTEERVSASAAALVTLNVCVVAAVGRLALPVAGEVWLVALAAVHALLGLRGLPRLAIAPWLRRLLVAIGVILADVAFGLSTSGVVLAAGWGAAAITFAWLLRRSSAGDTDQQLLGLGLGAHICLTLLRALLDGPPSQLGSGPAPVAAILSIAVLAASCLACSRLLGAARRGPVAALNILGLAATGYLTAQTLSGTALVIAWTLEASALARLEYYTHDAVTGYGAIGFLTLAVLHILAVEAPPSALLSGAPSLPAAAITLAAIGLTTLGAARHQTARPGLRDGLRAGAAGALFYLGSIAIITAFQPSGSVDGTLLELSVRQQGQALLSATWALLGLGGLILGLRTNVPRLRNLALGLLLGTIVKVFLYDLSTLTSIYRVISFIALGLLLLAGAFAYQRMRPPPPPDIRTLHPSQR